MMNNCNDGVSYNLMAHIRSQEIHDMKNEIFEEKMLPFHPLILPPPLGK